MTSTSSRHRWGDKVRFERKSERECARCGMIKVGRKEWPGNRESYWTEYWRDLDRVDQDGKTPPCDARLEVAA